MISEIRKEKLIHVIENMIRIGIAFVLSITVVLMVIAMVDRSSDEDEAGIGSFETETFNEGWVLSAPGKTEEINLPAKADVPVGETVTITNMLPQGLSDGMSLMIRSAMEDVRISVDGMLREEYATDASEGLSYYLPSAYVVMPLNSDDSGKKIDIEITFKTRAAINGITISHGNNVWFSVVRSALPTNLIAMLVLILGIVMSIAVIFMRNSYNVAAPRYLGLLMINVSLWVFSESTIRQFIFQRPSLSQYFAYFTVELIGVLACLYFDAVQHGKYHKQYIIVATISFAVLMINIVLHFTGILELYRTMIFAHIMTGVAAIVSTVCIVTDIVTKRIREYRITGLGMIGFVIMSLCELVGFYVNRFHIFGSFLCTALILLMAATIIQTVYDEVYAYHKRERDQSRMTINTIEIIAGAIDARDEYTGGHSERVGLYAGRLAREMAADYDLSEDDILRVQCIGLVHDIGKIGVADSVLNKSGRLTEEEFGLMKKHAEIGYEIMSSMGEGIEGLLDGIRHHHERFDGKGYPDGLSDTDIPLIARILALADSYDAMTSNRVYRKRLSDEEVREELLRCAGTQFDPALTEIFVRLLDHGQLRANTQDGVALNGEGEVLISSVLESRLQKDLLEQKLVVNPSHVRMLCYVIKLMEKKGKTYRVFFAGPEDPDADSRVWNKLRDTLRNYVGPHDINIQYTKLRNVIALYDRSDEETRAVLDAIRTACPSLSVTDLTGAAI